MRGGALIYWPVPPYWTEAEARSEPTSGAVTSLVVLQREPLPPELDAS